MPPGRRFSGEGASASTLRADAAWPKSSNVESTVGRRRFGQAACYIGACMSAVLLLTCAGVMAQPSDAPGAFDGLEPIAHLRTYDWDSRNTKGDPSAAWAIGGWAGLTTRWYGDLIRFGVLGYTSQKLYGPADKDGSQLLAPGQEPITVLGQAYGMLRYEGQTFTGYRQMVDQPWVNPYDSRMIPNLFEGYLLSGKAADVDYIGGYVTKFKARDSNAFAWMSSAAGSSGPQRGMVMLDARLPWADQSFVRIAEQDLLDAYNTGYLDGEYVVAIGHQDRLRLRGQCADQRSVGSAGLGDFSTWMVGAGMVYEHGAFSVQAGWTQTSRNRATIATFGANPSYLHLMQSDFNDAGERAWLIGGAVDFTPAGLSGLTLKVGYGSGRGAVDSSTGASLGSQNETDVQLAFATDRSSSLHGLSLGLEGSWLNQAGATAQGRQLRAFVNYEIPLPRL